MLTEEESGLVIIMIDSQTEVNVASYKLCDLSLHINRLLEIISIRRSRTCHLYKAEN